MSLLSRHAECAFWLARYLERAESMARILEAHVAFNRGRAIDAPWAWILALYADEAQFFEKFPEANAENVIQYYVTELDIDADGGTNAIHVMQPGSFADTFVVQQQRIAAPGGRR